MSNIEELIYTAVTGNAGIAALVSTRVYPMMLPQEPTLPAITYQRISTPRVTAHDGGTGLEYPRFQFDVYAATYAGARALAKLLVALFNAKKSAVTTGTVTFVESDRDNYDPDTGVFRRMVDVVLWCNDDA
jgi:hypothetical protein